MASGDENRGAENAPANDSIDELLDGLPADPMLPRKRARTIEEVKAASTPSSQNRRMDDKVLVSEGTDPRERRKREVEQARREHSTFGTAFLQARASREKVIFGIVMMLAVLGIYAFMRHALRPNRDTDASVGTRPVQTTSITTAPIPTTSGAPLATDDIPAPPASADLPPGGASAAAHASARAPHSAEPHAIRPPPSPSSSSGTRTDVSRSL